MINAPYPVLQNVNHYNNDAQPPEKNKPIMMPYCNNFNTVPIYPGYIYGNSNIPNMSSQYPPLDIGFNSHGNRLMFSPTSNLELLRSC
jgi:glucose-6-phosphate isomerase